MKSIRLFAILSTVSCAALIGSYEPVSAQMDEVNNIAKIEPAAPADVSLLTKVSLSNGLAAGRIGSQRFIDSRAMQDFYKARDNKPFWIGSDGLNGHAKDLISILEDSWTHGLNPKSYHFETLLNLASSSNLSKKAQLELLLTDAFVRYAHDMSGMRVDPVAMKLGEDHWRMPYKPHEILKILGQKGDVEDFLEDLVPKSKTYDRLRKELIRLSKESAESFADYQQVDLERRMLHPGERHKAVPIIRARLGIEPQSGDELRYDDRLLAAVIRLQQKNGLEPDGLIGDNTAEIINRNNKSRMLQVIANLERLRWVYEEKPERYVVVNIPSQTLWPLKTVVQPLTCR